jgi:hypothetical protein
LHFDSALNSAVTSGVSNCIYILCSVLISSAITVSPFPGNTALSLHVGTLLLNHETAPITNVSITLCAPISVEAFRASATAQLDLSACMTKSHTSLSLTLSITVIDVNEPPVFDATCLNLSAPGVGTVNQSIGFPLSRIASDPDTAHSTQSHSV